MPRTIDRDRRRARDTIWPVLALKLILAPALIAVATLAARRWGPAAAGWAASLPVVGGPILLVVVLSHGAHFAEQAATAATSGLASLAVFGVAYVQLATRLPWWAALPGGWAAFLAATALLWLVRLPVGAAVAVALVTFVVVHRLLGPDAAPAPPRRRLPLDLPLRMTAGACMVLALSAASAALGARLTGLLTPFPVIASVLAAFTHAVEGTAAVRRYTDALIRGLPSFAAFTTAIGLLAVPAGTAAAFVIGSLAAAASHAVLITRPWRALPRLRPVSTPAE